MFGVEGGVGKATIGKSYLTPTIEGYYLKKITRSFYVGATLSYQRYSFLYKSGIPTSVAGDGSIVSIRQRSGYVFASPTADFGIGYRKYIHVYASFGAGLLAEGRQLTNRIQQYQTTPPVTSAYDTTAYYTSNSLPLLISRYSLGITERIPTSGYWNIMLSQEFSYIPNNLTTEGPHLKTNYFAFTVGIMHKYPMVFVEY
jgi:hypothetical protein